MHVAMNRLFSIAVAVGITTSALAQDGQAIDARANLGGETQSSGESFASAFFRIRVTHASGEQTTDLIGTALLWTLLALSIISVGLIGYLALINQRKSIVPAGLVAEARRLLNGGHVRHAIDLTKTEQSFFSQVMHAGLGQANQGVAATIRALEQTADVLIAARMRPIEILYMLGQVSPMMGLLGTVYGIIFAFRVYVSMGGHATPAMLAGGIGTALVATFWGLVVAIPALTAYSILRNKVDQLTMEAMVAAEQLLMQLNSKPAVAGKPTPAPVATATPARPA